MAIYITLDAGGTKCNGILFDSDMNILGRGLSGGVNLSQTSPEDSRANMVDCIEQMFKTYRPERVDKIFLSFVGPVNVLYEELEKRTELGERLLLGEPLAGLYAGGIRDEGMLAIAGTGSDVFYITKQHQHERRQTVGAYGPLVGDQGSGVWIGQRAIREAVKGYEGWAPKTILLDLIMEAWGIDNVWGIVEKVHGSVAPFRTIGSVAPIVGQAARMGDEVALSIIRGAGEEMAAQAICLIERCNIPSEHRFMVACGGAWKAHPLMFDTFRARIRDRFPDVEVAKPIFEHVMCGPVKIMLDSGASREETVALLKNHFSDYVIKW